jgi:uncharacterized iron-regulated membrane protein
MEADAGGWLWMVIDVAFVLALAVALVYGVSMWRKRRSLAAERARDDATRQLYRRDESERETTSTASRS